MKNIQQECHKSIIKAVKLAGGQSALAKLCGHGIKQQQVYNWLHRDKRVSHRWALLVEKALNGAVTRYELRPDIYPKEE